MGNFFLKNAIFLHPFITQQTLVFSGFATFFFDFVFHQYITQIYVDLRKFAGKWCSSRCSIWNDFIL